MPKRASTGTGSGRKRLLILDDHPMMREGLAQLIEGEPDLSVCGQAGTGAEALDFAMKLKPDLMLVDISLQDKSGLDVIKDAQSLQPGLAMLVISMHDESLYAERVLRAGARGYIMKQEGGRKLLEAIRRVLDGRIYVSEKMSSLLLESLSGRPVARSSPIENLSDRELQVLQLIGEGKGTRDIAQHLRLSVKTIDAHRVNIRQKLNVKNGPELVRFAVRWVETQKSG